MPLPEGYLPRAGDVLVIHATVKYDVTSEDKGKVFARPLGYHSDFHLDLSAIEDVFSYKWEVTHRALYGSDAENTGEIVAIAENYAWFKLDRNGEHVTVLLSHLEPEPKAIPAVPAEETT